MTEAGPRVPYVDRLNSVSCLAVSLFGTLILERASDPLRLFENW